MSTQNSKTAIRWVSSSILLVWLCSAAALAQIFITVPPAERARLREEARTERVNLRVKTELVNPRVKLEASTARGRLSEVTARAAASVSSDLMAEQSSEADAESIPSSQVYGRQRNPFRHSYKEMTAQWWQWASGIPLATSPVEDKTGAFAFAGQRGDFWFLAGNGGGVDERVITLPANTPLFIPALTLMFFDDGTTGPISEEETRMLMKEYMDTATTLEISVDHQPLPRKAISRTQSERFTIAIPEGSIYGPDVPKGIYDICFADTYFTMLKPLSVGSHVIKIKGATPDFSSYVEYYIHVMPPSEALTEATTGHDANRQPQQ